MTENKTNTTPERVTELTELSEENKKVYLMSDGTEQMEISLQTTQASPLARTMANSDSQNFTMYSWKDSVMSEAEEFTIGTKTEQETNTVNRMYMTFTAPELPNNPRIKKAELTIYQKSITCEAAEYPKFILYNVTGDITTGQCTPNYSSIPVDYEKVSNGNNISYTLDVTGIVNSMTLGSEQKIVFKMFDETVTNSNIVIYGNGDSTYCPKLCVTYDSSYGKNPDYRTHTHNIGRAMKGSIDLACGNLMFESEDFMWGGNRMPVTIKHLYNSALAEYNYTNNVDIKLNTADFSAMKIGKGWKLNIMKSMISKTFWHDKTQYAGYVYTDENGEEIYFKRSNKTAQSATGNYYLYENIEDSEMIYDPVNRTLTQGGYVEQFSSSGALVKITDEYGSNMTITYQSGRITSVTDGADRSFVFSYNTSGQLVSITAPDQTKIEYNYTNEFLSKIEYPDSNTITISYLSSYPSTLYLKDADGNPLSKFTYSVNTSTGKVTYVTEYGVENGEYIKGESSSYSVYSNNYKTTVRVTVPADTEEGETEDKVINTTYVFDNEDNIISEYALIDGENVAVEGNAEGVNPYSNSEGINISTSINNLLNAPNFVADYYWLPLNDSMDNVTIYANDERENSKYRLMSLYINNYNEEKPDGAYELVSDLPAGQYTFSSYVKVKEEFLAENEGAYIQVTDTEGNVLSTSEKVSKKHSDFIRLVTTFELTETTSVKACLVLNGRGAVYFSNAILEKGSVASRYNYIENSGFEQNLSGWSKGNESSQINMLQPGFNNEKALFINDSSCRENYVYQDIYLERDKSTRETFTLSGWSQGSLSAKRERDGLPDSQHRLKAEIHYVHSDDFDSDIEEFSAEFVEADSGWQYSSVEFCKSEYREVNFVRILCENSYTYGKAYFDDIMLTRNSIEKELTPEDFFNPEYDEEETTSDEPEIVLSAPEFEELKDELGNNLTETTFVDGELGTIYRSFGYGEDSSLTSETDARGNRTTYNVNGLTSRNDEITDRCGNKTAYEYDAMGRTTKVISKDSENTEIANVSYFYDAFDNLSQIVRGDGLKYVLKYNAFHNLESIGVDGKSEKLISYSYKNGNGRLKELSFANGDYMKAAYNSLGQMISEKWYDKNDSLTAHYKYLYDLEGNIVRSIDILNEKEYTYTYEDSRLVKSAEYEITLNENELVVSRNEIGSVIYYYNKDNELVRKDILSALGTSRTVFYENPDEKNQVVKFSVDDLGIVSHSKNDSFGRKDFDELQFKSGFVSREFEYLKGEATQAHLENDSLKSVPTTQLVSKLTFSTGRTISYEYDNEERITKVIDSVDGITEYTYDALGQLLTEKKNDQNINVMSYDNYGNILQKNGVQYEYDSVWKDKLIKVGNKTITYDEQGNPTNYLGKTAVWEKGRQLKSFGDISFEYNANGIRTSKTVEGVKHSYILDGTKILLQSWNDNILETLYDNEDSVCGIVYNGAPYFFHKNLQGDIIAIADTEGKIVARYSYDAWGNATVTYSAPDGSIATINPYRYRGYYFDPETNLYYLQSRYYDPTTGRFLNADEVEFAFIGVDSVNCSNLFAYCENNPVLFSDHTGMLPLWAKITIGIAGIVAAIALTVASGGTLFPAILTTLKFVAGSMAINMAISALVGYIQNGMSGLMQGLLNGAIEGFMWGGIGAALNAAVAFIKVMKTVKTIRNFTVSKKHLSYAGGNWSKFNTANQNTIRDWIRKAVLKGTPMPNGNSKDSFVIVYKIGKVIGKSGEKCIRVVYDKAGNIWTAFPVK